MKRYAIEVIGCGRKTRYCLKEIMENGTNPVKGAAISYRTEDAARAAAADLGFEISAVGDIWQIIRGAKA